MLQLIPSKARLINLSAQAELSRANSSKNYIYIYRYIYIVEDVCTVA